MRLFSTIIATILLATSCSYNSNAIGEMIAVRGEMLGTSYSIKADLPPNAVSEVAKRASELDLQMKAEMSIFNKESQLNNINNNTDLSITPALERNIMLADSVSRLSGGIYDITVAPLVKAWGFANADDKVASPNIDSLLEFVGYDKISIRDGVLCKSDPRIQIDLNSIAKGYTVDRLAEIISDMGAKNYMVEIGGEIRLQGRNPKGEAWKVGIEQPFDGNVMVGEFLEQRVAIADTLAMRAVATSGNYRRFYINDEGDKIVHVINPITGTSAQSSLLSVTVLAPTCALADAYATMLLAAGDQRAEQIAKQIENCEVYLIYYNKEGLDNGSSSHYRTYFSDGMRALLLD